MRVEDTAFMREYCRVCNDGFAFGWHEANGGNLSYRLTGDERAQANDDLREPSGWTPLAQPVPQLAGEWLLVSGSGVHFRSVSETPSSSLGLIELDDAGAGWRLRWGFDTGAQPTSELAMHLQCHELRKTATGGTSRIVYHAHPQSIITLSNIIEPDVQRWTQALWQCMTECVVVFPGGVGVVPWCVPGSAELAQATCDAMKRFAVCVWMQHGPVATGSTFDEAFGAVHTVEKAAELYLSARSACGGAEPPARVTSEQLRMIAERYDLDLDETLLPA